MAMRRWLCLCAVLLLGAAELLPSRSVQSQGRSWTYYTAAARGRSGKLPLVVLFHGAGGSGGGFLQRSGWADKARQEGFVAVAPSGLARDPEQLPDFLTNPRIWNTGQFPVGEARRRCDDVRFVLDMLVDVELANPIDADRIYLVGHSNGATFCTRLAAAFPNRFAGLGLVAGPAQPPSTPFSRPIPTIFVLGEQDPIVPLAGGLIETPWGPRDAQPVQQMLKYWALALGYSGPPEAGPEDEHQRTQDYGKNLRVTYLKGHGHNYPAADLPLADSSFGPVNQALSATDLIWDFFAGPTAMDL